MNDLISRQAAIYEVKELIRMGDCYCDEHSIIGTLNSLPPVQLERIIGNAINLCDSCAHNYPECPSKAEDVIFGDGKGNDNVCACNKYMPKEHKTGNWLADFDGYADEEPVYDMWWCSECGEYFDEWDDKPTWKFCPNCGAQMNCGNDDDT